jgi:DNA-binding NarL/FixJ family response regulator
MARNIKKLQTKKSKITVAILEDNATLVKGMMAELEKPDITVTVVGDNIDKFLEELKSSQPSIAIVDLRIWKDLDAGFVAITKSRELSPSTRFIIYTAYDLIEKFHKGIVLGVKAFVSKNIYEKPLDEVVRIVHDGGTYYGDLLPEYLGKLNESSIQLEFEKGKRSSAKEGLSKREIEILDYLDKGTTNEETAKEIFVSVNTVKAHTKNIREKLGVKTTTEAIRVYRLRKKSDDPTKE